jgi:hypothetical protein
MRIFFRLFCLALLLAALLSACASRPRPAGIKTPPGKEPAEKTPMVLSQPPEILPPPLEQALVKIKQNGKDIAKYFILEEGRIIVKSGLRDENGDFEITYDLENARDLGNSAYEVAFTFHDKESGMILEHMLVWNPLAGAGGLLLSFDDDYVDSWEGHFDLFEKYKARVTFFIQGKTNPFCAKALDRGHDIGYHSLNHRDLRKITREEFGRETVESALPFRQAGIPLSAFAYPFGFSESWMHDVLLRSFGTLRGYGVTFRLYSEAEIRQGYISSRAVDNTVIPKDDDFFRIVRLMLMTVKFLDAKLVLPLTTHDISDTAAWGISLRRLEFLLKTANELGLTFYCYSDFAGEGE